MDNLSSPHKKIDNNHVSKKETETPVVAAVDSKSHGLLNVRAVIFLLLWYIFSGCTLFLNKYILTYMNGNPTILGMYWCRW